MEAVYKQLSIYLYIRQEIKPTEINNAKAKKQEKKPLLVLYNNNANNRIIVVFKSRLI